jgi:hypothetical protein
MPGPAPNPNRQRRNRTSTAATLSATAATKVPLPAGRWSSITCAQCRLAKWSHTRRWFDEAEVEPHDYDPRPIDWKPQTLSWWETIWASPMVEEWVNADVPGLLALAVLVDEFWTFGDSKIHAEMRQASREFGLSPLSRRQLQWEVKKVKGAVVAPAPPPAVRRTNRGSSLTSSVVDIATREAIG